MKNLLSCLLLVYVVFFSSCDKKKCESVVKINPDGSCFREFSLTGADSAFMVGDTSKNPFPMKLDSSWKVSWKYSSIKHPGTGGVWPVKNWVWDKDTSRQLTLTVFSHKEFKSVDEMATSFRYNHSEWDEIVPIISLEKKFRFFFTLYTYKEIYPKYNPLVHVPVNKYLSDEEIKTYFGENPKFNPELNGSEIKEVLDAIDNKSEEWFNRSIFEEVYFSLSNQLFVLNQLKIDSITFIQSKDSVYEYIKDKEEIKNHLGEGFNKYFKTNVFVKSDSLKGIIKDVYEEVEGKIMKPFLFEMKYNLLMPGKVLHTTSKQVHGDTLTWKLEPYRFFLTDYEIMAESRVANVWAFLVSGLFLIIVVVSFFIKRK